MDPVLLLVIAAYAIAAYAVVMFVGALVMPDEDLGYDPPYLVLAIPMMLFPPISFPMVWLGSWCRSELIDPAAWRLVTLLRARSRKRTRRA